MKHYYLLYFCILINLTPLKAQIKSGSVLKGRVLEAITNKPIQGANVYLIGTMKGAVTDRNGDYIIKNVPNSSFFVIASCIGFKSQKKKVNINKRDVILLDYSLFEKVYDLPEVTVIEDFADEWKNNYKIFREQFIGILKNSDYTEILNPYIISFKTTEKGWLSAEASEPILIRSNILGYEIKYYLDTFLYQYPTVMYSGQPFFSEIITKDPKLKNEIKRARKETYCGSLRHFLYVAAKQFMQDSIKKTKTKNLVSEEGINISLLEKHGFKVYTENHFNIDERIINPIVYRVKMNKYFKFVEKTSQLYLKITEKLRILYNREYEDKYLIEKAGAKENVKRKFQTSWISLSSDSVLIDTTGYLFDKFSIQTFGYWAYERVANSLPYEYSLPDSVLINYNLEKEMQDEMSFTK